MAQIGVIHEIGDFGSDFGFDPLSAQDQKVYEQTMQSQDKQSANTQVINEEKKETK